MDPLFAEACPGLSESRASNCAGPSRFAGGPMHFPGTRVKVSSRNAPDFTSLNSNITCLRPRGPPFHRGNIGNQPHAGVLTHGGDTGNSCGLVVKSLGHCHHGAIRRSQTEPEIRLRVNEQFEHSGHSNPPGLRDPPLRRRCHGADADAPLRPLPAGFVLQSKRSVHHVLNESRSRQPVSTRPPARSPGMEKFRNVRLGFSVLSNSWTLQLQRHRPLEAIDGGSGPAVISGHQRSGTLSRTR